MQRLRSPTGHGPTHADLHQAVVDLGDRPGLNDGDAKYSGHGPRPLGFHRIGGAFGDDLRQLAQIDRIGLLRFERPDQAVHEPILNDVHVLGTNESSETLKTVSKHKSSM